MVIKLIKKCTKELFNYLVPAKNNFVRPNLGDLVDKLSICNCKLYELCNRKTDASDASWTKEDLQKILLKDIELCKERAMLKNEINKLMGEHIKEVKNY